MEPSRTHRRVAAMKTEMELGMRMRARVERMAPMRM